MEPIEKLAWHARASTSHYHTAVAIRDALQEGNVADATNGIEELIEALSRSEERALESYLIRLMQHLITWKAQPERRSHSLVATIRETRKQARRLQQRYPRFADVYVREQLWADCYDSAINEAEKDMNRPLLTPPLLTWEEVFDQQYILEPPTTGG